MKTCEDKLLLKCSIEAGASLEALAKGNKKTPNKRKRGSICTHYYRTRSRLKFESFKSPDLSFFDKCKKLQDHATHNHEAHVIFSACLENSFGSIATANLVDKSAPECYESVQNDYMNGSMREDGSCKLTETVCVLLTDNLMTFFDPGIEPKDDTHMHDKDDWYNSSDGTEVEYASLPVSLPSFSVEDYIVCSLNTEDTVDNIPDSQLLDSPENVLEDPSFHDDEHDVCHSEDDVELTSISHLYPVHLSEGKFTCILNTEDPEIPCNDNIFSVTRPSPYVTRLITATESIDPSPSFSQSHMDGPSLQSEYDSANPHVGDTYKSVSMDHNPSISDHDNSDNDSDLDIEDPEIPCDDNIFLRIHQSPSVRCRTAPDSIDPASSLTQSKMDGSGLSSEFDSANPHVGCTPKSVSMDHNPSISDHHNNDPEIPSPSVRPETATDSIEPATCLTNSQMDDPAVSSEFDFANLHVGCTHKSVSMDHNPSVSDRDSHSDLPCVPDIEDPEIPTPSVRPRTVTNSSDPASCFTQSQMDDQGLSSEFDSSNPHVGCDLKSVSMDHNPSISDHKTDSDLPCFPDTEDSDIPSPCVKTETADFVDQMSSFTQPLMDGPDLSSVSVDHNLSISDDNNSDSDSDLPCLPDIEALIRKLDYEYAQDSWITNEAKSGKYRHCKRSISRLEQSSSQRVMSSLGAFAVFYSRHFNYYIKKTEVTVGRSTDDTEVDIDLRKESHANMISRQQATIKMETDGTFTLKNIGKGSILVNGESVARGQAAALISCCLIQIRGMDFMFDMDDRYVRRYLDNIMKKPQGKFTAFEWSVN
ncbi:putative transcription factor interactor and regulator FHA-SMAD family [Helianthus annuus]|nr:putative transcription factor interactor and regulator FHA-SMAD family [Helianthus annuus]